MTRRTRTAMHICDYIGARMAGGAGAGPAKVIGRMRVAVIYVRDLIRMTRRTRCRTAAGNRGLDICQRR